MNGHSWELTLNRGFGVQRAWLLQLYRMQFTIAFYIKSYKIFYYESSELKTDAQQNSWLNWNKKFAIAAIHRLWQERLKDRRLTKNEFEEIMGILTAYEHDWRKFGPRVQDITPFKSVAWE